MKVSDLTDGQLILAYRRARERRDEAKSKFMESQKPLLEVMQAIEAEGLKRMLDRDTDSFKSKETGTCYRITETSVTSKDKNAFFEWCMNEDHWDMADVRPSKSAVQDFAEKTGGELPPGVDMTQRFVARFRAPSHK